MGKYILIKTEKRRDPWIGCGVFRSDRLVGLGNQRAGEFLKEEETAGDGRNPARRDPARRTVAERHPKGHALPLHSATERTIGAADCVVCLEHETRTHRIRAARHERGAALEGRESVLLDGERVELNSDTVGLLLPLGVRLEFAANLRFPEGDVAHTANAVHENELGALLLEFGNLLGIGGEILLRGEVTVIRRNGEVAERIVERLLHCILEGSIADERIALLVGPLVHIEAPHVLAGDVPLLEEVDSPLVHSHRTYRKDERDLLSRILGLADFVGDLVTHLGVELGKIGALLRLEILVPELLRLGDILRLVLAALVDLLHVPTCRIESLKHGTLDRRHKVH